MKSLLKTLLLGVVLSFMYVVPGPAKADDYWNNHWNWYDNTYRPYYYRNGYGNNNYYSQGYGNYYGPGYGNYSNSGYGYPGYGNNGYGAPYRNYTGTSNFGYGRTFGGGQAVNVGGMQFGWR